MTRRTRKPTGMTIVRTAVPLLAAALAAGQARAAVTTTPRALAIGDTYRLLVDGYTGDEATTEPKTDANDGLNGDNPYYRRTNVARAHDGGGGAYWYTSSYQNAGEPDPCGPQYVDYKPPLTVLGAGRYRITAEYRNTTSRASYPAQYIVNHAAGTTTILKSQRDGTSGAYVTFDLGDFDLGSTGWVRVNDTGCESLTFNKMDFTYMGPASTKATYPSPPHQAVGVFPTAKLSWLPGIGATSSDVYFGTVSPGSFRGNQTASTFDPGGMAPNTTYYWRIDSVGPGGTVTGDIWSFTTGSGTYTYSTQYEFDAAPDTAAGVLDANPSDANGNGLLTKVGTGFGNTGGGISGGILRYVDSTSSGNHGYYFAAGGSTISFTIDMRVRVNAGVAGTTLRRSMGFSGGASKNIGLRLHATNDGSGSTCTDGSVRLAVGTGGTGSEACLSFGSFRRLRVSANAGTNTFKVFDLDTGAELTSASGGGGSSLAWATEINNQGGYHIGSISASNTTSTDYELDYFRVLLGTAVEDATTVISQIPPPCANPPSVTSITPGNARQGQSLTGVVVQGSDFVAGGTGVTFTREGEPDIAATNIAVAGDGNSLTCDVNLAPAVAGLWNVVVTTTGNCPAATLSNGFEVRPLCNNPPQDTDEDGDVDLADFTQFQTCFNGPNRPWPSEADARLCECVDADNDVDVDLTDFSVLQACFNGPNRPAPQPTCDIANGIEG